MEDSSCRLLTIIGAGGIGKTRLAVELACAEGERFADGACFVSLAGVDSPELVVPAVAQAVRLAFSDPAEPRAQLINYLRPKRALILLDNMEHLLDAVEEIAALLKGAPEIKLLVTSRERLQLSEEWVFEVQGLPVPAESEGKELKTYGAVKLFVQRAKRARVDFKLLPEERVDVVRNCRLAEGMPLAFELAAAWVRLLSCAEIAAEIEQGLDFLAGAMRDARPGQPVNSTAPR